MLHASGLTPVPSRWAGDAGQLHAPGGEMIDGGNKSPHYVDQHVGMRIRNLRRRLHVSQEALVEQLGLTFQQVQKYETGSNRVSASKLFEVATALGVQIDYFFQDLPPSNADTDVPGSAKPSGAAQPGDREPPLEKLLDAMGGRHRRLVLDLARALAQDVVAQD